MRVELDLFSGRPNPGWELAAGETEAINAMLASLPHGVPGSRLDEGALGYRGFRIIDSARDRSVTVRGTTVDIASAQTVSTATDEQARLEQALVDIARSHLDPATYEFLVSQLNP